MPVDSKRKRYTRRLKRQRNQAMRLAEATMDQLDLFKQIALEMRLKELKAEEAQKESESLIVKPTLKQTAQVALATEKQ